MKTEILCVIVYLAVGSEAPKTSSIPKAWSYERPRPTFESPHPCTPALQCLSVSDHTEYEELICSEFTDDSVKHYVKLNSECALKVFRCSMNPIWCHKAQGVRPEDCGPEVNVFKVVDGKVKVDKGSTIFKKFTKAFKKENRL